ncbi:MAG: valine--tRNA ligase [Dissulfuribacterales bacterium]
MSLSTDLTTTDTQTNSSKPTALQTAPIDKSYEFQEVEAKWLNDWAQAGLSIATMDSTKPCFSMVIPPPNVTGVLHIGHALNNTLQDILIRYKRMDGYNTLWVPGTDHAGIATQNVVERQLAQEGLSRHKLGREAFIQRVWEWKAKSGGRILEQLKRLGCSCDWSRERFTFDEGLSLAVKEVFVRLYEEGLIYKGDYIINWCPRCHTALADIEVEHEPQEGCIWRLKYPLKDETGYVVVATTRPETMLGDTAVAVNPNDARYAHLIGKELMLPLVNRPIPIIADDTVDMEFGTGAVKITPAHDFNDFETGLRHNLPVINIFDTSAHVNENGGKYQGMDRYEARKRILEDMSAIGLLEAEEKHSLAIGGCYRCKTVVEPRISKQWFVRTQPLAQKALAAVREKETVILPASWEKTYEEWMTNIKDWCISRQIWWGHRIPAWTCKTCGETIVAKDTPTACTKCNSTDLEQETDVLDTWFSSALWPFSTLGWPEKTRELEMFYPTSVLITSFDILFFWVARMLMMGIHFMEEVPFRYVYLHALVRDSQGQKMSKSKGNVIDPLTVMEKYGTDAVRMTLTALAAQGRDIKLAEDRIEGYRHFINKIWNATRLVLMNVNDSFEPLKDPESLIPRALKDKWILARLGKLIQSTRHNLDNFEFDEAARGLYHFFWHEYCDWYLELAKPAFQSLNDQERRITQQTAITVLDICLRLLHPIIPFVTEELWHNLPGSSGHIMTAEFPRPVPAWQNETAEAQMQELIEIITGIRNLRSEFNIHPGIRLKVQVFPHDDGIRELFSAQKTHLLALAKLETIDFYDTSQPRPKNAASVILKDVEIFIPLKDVIDLAGELKKLQKEEEKLLNDLQKTQAKLNNADFMARAPQEIREKEQQRFTDIETRLKRIKDHKATLSTIET